MSRKSARYIAQELIGYTAADVYEIWKDMGYTTVLIRPSPMDT